MMFIPSILLFLAVFGVGFVLLDIVLRERYIDPQLGRFEVARRIQLRQASSTYRWFEPWVDQLVVYLEKTYKGLDDIQKHLLASANPAPWKPAEFLACTRIEAMGAAVLGFGFGWSLGDLTYATVGCIGTLIGYELLVKRLLKSQAVRRQLKLKRQFAATIDLMALMMEVGGGFHEALSVAAQETVGTPLGDELAIVRRDLALGKRDDALRNLVKRTQDEDIDEVVMAIIEGQDLGTPLAKIFRIQAEQMRLKRTQWAEKASAESEVALVFPAMLIMLACLILIAAPFVLSAFIPS